MAASKVDDEAKKKETVNKQEVESLTNMLFLRKNTEKVSPYQKFNKKAAKGVREFCEAHLVGTIDEGPPSATVSWRIMGMRMRFAIILYIYYRNYVTLCVCNQIWWPQVAVSGGITASTGISRHPKVRKPMETGPAI
ncbi:hypothetical protein Y032_0008g38 [Ancylostoma ceylanicum]|uniref:Uncharacterized protein n=1 Tax=Ancylostoma ceylanicum TaxID=53326 RepID=A0A016VN45_9BILA|nr:hypothetical protein Y032_0008g38 [Ancylostoma ceylanicum]